MRSFRRGSILLLLVLGAPVLAQAAWQPDGNLIGTGSGFVATASGPDRVIVAWLRPSGGVSEVRASAWTADGARVAGWPAEGVLVSGGLAGIGSAAVAEDGAGGVFVAWTALEGGYQNVRLQHLSASGGVAGGWPAEGVALGASYPVALAPDGAGGVLVGRLEYDGPNPLFDHRVIVHRFDGAAASVPGWPAEGLPFPHTYEVGLLVDADHHVFVSTVESDRTAQQQWLGLGMIVRRLQENGTPDPAWPANGVLIEDGRYGSRPRLLPDGAGGAFPEWALNYVCIDYCPYVPSQWAARVLGDGSTHGGWNPPRSGYSIAPDGTGGILVGLIDSGRPAAARLDANGSAMPGWVPEGNVAMTESVRPNEIGVTGDGQGGAYVTWVDSRGDNFRIYASRLDATGKLASGWPSTGSVVSKHAHPFGSALVSLGSPVAVVVWQEGVVNGQNGTLGYLTALRPGEPGPRVEPAPVRFGVVSIRPNPARGPIIATVELPGAGSARLELVDATGRLVDSREFELQAQARGEVQLNEGRTLPAGVYWLRLTQGGRVASKKAVLLE
jgi:hypothetical protein